MTTAPKSKSDTRLPNKAEVLALRVPAVNTNANANAKAGMDTLAISADFLATRAVYSLRMGNTNMVALTDASSANRV